MKQNITKKQWEELNPDEMDKFSEHVEDFEHLGGVPTFHLPNIGQMIEFLGDDFIGIEIEEGGWRVKTYFEKDKRLEKWERGELKEIDLEDLEVDILPELSDPLWEAVKYKLKNT